MVIRTYIRAKTSLQALGATLRDEEGIVSTEFGLLLVLIALAIIASATALGLAITHLLDHGTSGVKSV